MVRIDMKTWLSSSAMTSAARPWSRRSSPCPADLGHRRDLRIFEVHRYSSARDKASYTIADIISREMLPITPTYLTNAKSVFDTITNDNGQNALRVSIIKYDADEDEYSIKWSEVRGTSKLVALTTADVRTAHARLPMMRDGEELIVVDSLSHYPPMFDVWFGDNMQVATHVITSPRFAPQINWENG